MENEELFEQCKGKILKALDSLSEEDKKKNTSEWVYCRNKC